MLPIQSLSKFELMRKHSLNVINSQQNLKELLYSEYQRRIPPPEASQKRQHTRPKKKEATASSWVLKNRLAAHENKKGTVRTNKKNSCSYIACNTSLESSSPRHPHTGSFANLKQQAHPISTTEAHDDPPIPAETYRALIGRVGLTLVRYEQLLQQNERKMRELRKENKQLKEKCRRQGRK